MQVLQKIIFVLLTAVFWGCGNSDKTSTASGKSEQPITDHSAKLPLDKIKLPPGFKIAVFGEVYNARSLAVSPSGVVYVGNKEGDNVYALQDTDEDHVADKRWVIARKLNTPNGVAFKDGDLYVAEVNRILKYEDIESRLGNSPDPIIVTDDYPNENWHGWKNIAFGPDGKLYVPVGAPCNVCESDNEIFATITRINADGSGREIVARGVRNSVGVAWHPETKEMWFTDNGRDNLGDDVPPCEVNRAANEGMNFGFPYCHGGFIKDPDFGNKKNCDEFTKPVQNLGAHVAALGLKFYSGEMFPAEYKNQLFIAEHGSWNRSKKIGYRISLIKINDNTTSGGYETFASGWLDDATQRNWGRPVDVLVMRDGSLLVSDDQAGVVYRISYRE
jgi:glucose/arabinose dehydrogenase